jgi:hypothetical protein
VALSHDHYPTISGGVQNVLGDEQRALVASGWAFVHVCPNQPLPLLADPTNAADFHLVLSLNGSTFGVVRMADLITVIGDLAKSGKTVRPIVHHLLGHAPELVAELIKASATERPIVWVHDLFTLCPSVHLLRNEVIFCQAPPVNSAVCGICHCGSERPSHVSRMRAFFSAVNAVVAAPSLTLLDFWARHGGYDYSDKEVVTPSRVEFEGTRGAIPEGRPIRVAFIGTPIFHKGWDVYQGLARWHATDKRYDFYHFGSRDVGTPGVKFIDVTVTAEDRLAMARAVRKHDIDIVINWSACFESFSFTTQEAMAAGAFVIARHDAGNVWPMVKATSETRGRSLMTEVELLAAFADGRVIDWLSDADRRYGRIELSRYSETLLATERVA